MTLLEQWNSVAYDTTADKNELAKFWKDHYDLEKGVYEKLLEHPDEVVTGTVKELAEKFEVPVLDMVGILDGIQTSLIEENPLETMEEDTVVNLGFDKEKLYINMVDNKADWLYNLPAWDTILEKEQRARLYRQAKTMHIVVKPKKIGRNEPCPCGSGKKYKVCHGRTAELQEELQELLAKREA